MGFFALGHTELVGASGVLTPNSDPNASQS